MSNTLVGRDVTAYAVTGAGFQSLDGNVGSVGEFNLLGTWKDIEITLNYNWADRTPSGGDWETKRRTTRSFKGSCKNMVNSAGSSAMFSALSGDQVFMRFTTLDGKQMFCYAGISDAGLTVGKDGVDDSLNFECIGLYNGGDPISYE